MTIILYKKNGSSVVEASLVMPIVILSVIALIYAGMVLYQKAYLQALADKAAELGAAAWCSPSMDLEMGQVKRSDFENAQLYWRLIDNKKQEKLRCVESYIINGKNSSGLDRSGLIKPIEDRDKIDVTLIDNIVSKKLNIKITETYKTPFAGLIKLFGLDGGFTVKVQSEAAINEQAEFIRNTDFVIDIERELEVKFPALKSAGNKVREAISGIKESIDKNFSDKR